jgi:hypothetical protein
MNRYRKYPNSIFIFVLETCHNGRYFGEIRFLPLFSYPHACDTSCFKGSPQQKHSFPNFYYCNGCDNNYYWLSGLQPHNNVMGRKFRGRRKNLVPLLTELDGFDYYGDFDCNRRNLELNSIKEEKFCFVGDYIVGILQDKLNFTKIPSNPVNIYRPSVVHGFITELFYAEFSTAEAPWNFLLIETEMTVIYCDFSPPQTTKVSFRAWWAPYRWNVWAILLTGLSGLSIVLAYYKLCAKIRYNGLSIRKKLLIFLRSWSDRWLEIIRFILRQDDNQSWFLITCAYFMLIFTSLYENIITSQLIVPDAVRRYETVDELTDDGYSIIILCDQDLMSKRKLPDSVNQTFAKIFVKNGRSTDDFYERVKFEFLDASSDAFLTQVGNASLKHAVFQMTSNDFLSHLLSKMHGISCYPIRNSIAGSLKFMYFANFLVYEQLRLALLMRDHGFISWFYQQQEYSQRVYVGHLKGPANGATEKVSAYISNMNLVPVYSVWFAFNLIGVALLCVERNCDYDRYILRIRIFLAWSRTKANSFVRGSVLLLRTLMKSVRAFHNYVIGLGLFKNSPIMQLRHGMKKIVGKKN